MSLLGDSREIKTQIRFESFKFFFRIANQKDESQIKITDFVAEHG